MFEQIKEIIVENLGVSEDKVTLTSHLSDDLGADSLDAVEISMAIEESFGISIPDEALEKFETVQNIVDYVNKENA